MRGLNPAFPAFFIKKLYIAKKSYIIVKVQMSIVQKNRQIGQMPKGEFIWVNILEQMDFAVKPMKFLP